MDSPQDLHIIRLVVDGAIDVKSRGSQRFIALKRNWKPIFGNQYAARTEGIPNVIQNSAQKRRCSLKVGQLCEDYIVYEMKHNLWNEEACSPRNLQLGHLALIKTRFPTHLSRLGRRQHKSENLHQIGH